VPVFEFDLKVTVKSKLLTWPVMYSIVAVYACVVSRFVSCRVPT